MSGDDALAPEGTFATPEGPLLMLWSWISQFAAFSLSDVSVLTSLMNAASTMTQRCEREPLIPAVREPRAARDQA